MFAKVLWWLESAVQVHVLSLTIVMLFPFQAVVKSASLILKKVPVMLFALTVLDINYAGIIDISRRNGK